MKSRTRIEIKRKPRETSYRRWVLLARVMRWAPLAAAVVVFGLIAAEQLPEHWAQLEYLAAVTLPFLGMCLLASWLAERRYAAMTSEWGHRKAVKLGLVPNDLAKDGDR
jgi:hypothetical protein